LGFDCLITDYSSACFEFAPVSNNVIFYTPDIDAYIYNRGFDNHMSEMIKITGIRNIHDLRDAILQLYNGEKYFALDYFSYVGSSKGCMESIYAKFR
ncbi:TPA: CDP-glycerol glycerophosphotransferase family protein, partial [Escherichia coli]